MSYKSYVIPFNLSIFLPNISGNWQEQVAHPKVLTEKVFNERAMPVDAGRVTETNKDTNNKKELPLLLGLRNKKRESN